MIHAGRALVAAGLLATLAGPGQAWADGTTAAAPGGADIVNGIPTHLQPTTGALLYVGPDTKNQFLDCSVVLIGCRTALTAAHCICKNSDNFGRCETRELADTDPADLRVFFQHSGIHHVRDIFISPDYDLGKRSDIAVLRLSEKVTGVEPAKIYDDNGPSVPRGTGGIIAGFGNSGDDRLDVAIKRVGGVRTADCAPGIVEPANICWNYEEPILKPGNDSNLCFKDDGGPLFLDLGNGPVVAGIHSGGGNTCDPDSFAYDTNVYKNREWIRAVGGLDVGRDECSDLGEVGVPWVSVQGGKGVLPRSEDEARFDFDIPEDTILLRVTVNGDTEKFGDYDLFVGLDNPPTKVVNDCKSRGVGQFGVCEIENPDAEKVHVLVRHVKQGQGIGRSRFQVTVTAIQPTPPEGPVPRRPEQLRYEVRGPNLRRLLWKDASKDESGFQVQRKAGFDPETPFSFEASVKANKTTYLDIIPDGQIFTYRVRALNVNGFSDWSNECAVNHPGPRTPWRLRADSVSGHAVALRWKDRSTDETGFELQRRELGDLKWEDVAINDADDVTYNDNGLDSGTTYEYRVRARGRLGNCIPHSRFSPKLEISTLGHDD